VTAYKVTGPSAFMGHKPGEVFEAELDEALERRALERGSIKKVRTNKPKEEVEDDAETDRA
jgi:hypothetical protein